MGIFDKMGYDDETKATMAIVRGETGLTNESLVILHENTKVNNIEFLQKVNDYIVNECMSTQDANRFIQENNTLDIPELK